MPQVIAPSRVDQNGQSTTYFVDTVGTTATTYTYAVQQDSLVIVNNGNAVMTLTVNGVAYTLQGKQAQAINSPFTAFTVVVASGTHSFTASSTSRTVASVVLTGSNMELYGKSTDTKPTTGVKVGTTFFAIDTKTVYMWDGTTWVVI